MCLFDYSPLIATHQIGPEDEPIIAWKALKLSSYPESVLISPYMYTRWPWSTRRITTRTKAAIDPTPRKGKGGVTPGIYAYKSATVCEHNAHHTRRVRVKLELRGTVHEYARASHTPGGYRATEATIVEAVAKTDQQKRTIEEAYPGLKVRVA